MEGSFIVQAIAAQDESKLDTHHEDMPFHPSIDTLGNRVQGIDPPERS